MLYLGLLCSATWHVSAKLYGIYAVLFSARLYCDSLGITCGDYRVVALPSVCVGPRLAAACVAAVWVGGVSDLVSADRAPPQFLSLIHI